MSLHLRRGLVAAGLAAAVAAAVVAPPSETLASWSDVETAKADFAAVELRPPASASCTTEWRLLRTVARVNWSAPVGGLAPDSTYALRVTNVSVTPNTVEYVPMATLTVLFDDGLIGSGLLGGILTDNATLRVDVFTVPSTTPLPLASAWRSAAVPATPLEVRHSGGLLSGSFACN
ncbi:MAG: hypothetical protein M3Y46_02025 [Actinomycetota bacterium]|nr:hypothetical protein [Actinomycetota bacterium]